MKNKLQQSKIWVGIDVSKVELEIHSSEPIRALPKVVPNTSVGFKGLALALKGSASVHLVFESTGGYEKPLFHYFAALGIACSRLNPSHSRNFAKAKGLLAKTDEIDAFVLSEFGRQLDPIPSETNAPIIDALKEVIHYKNHLINARHREKMQLEHDKPAAIKAMIKARIKSLDKQIEKTKQMMIDLSSQDEKFVGEISILEQTQGVGKQTAIAIITALPELGIINNREITALAGLAPYNRDSGTIRGKRCIAGGRKTARDALYMAALVGARCNPILKEFYQRLRANGKPFKIAITAVMRKLLTHLNALLKRHYIASDPVINLTVS